MSGDPDGRSLKQFPPPRNFPLWVVFCDENTGRHLALGALSYTPSSSYERRELPAAKGVDTRRKKRKAQKLARRKNRAKK